MQILLHGRIVISKLACMAKAHVILTYDTDVPPLLLPVCSIGTVLCMELLLCCMFYDFTAEPISRQKRKRYAVRWSYKEQPEVDSSYPVATLYPEA